MLLVKQDVDVLMRIPKGAGLIRGRRLLFLLFESVSEYEAVSRICVQENFYKES